MKVFHKPQGPVRAGGELCFFARTEGEGTPVLLLWRDGETPRPIPMERTEAGYQARLTAPAEPCLLWYAFQDQPGGPWQRTVYTPDAAPDWYTGGVAYQIFPDRFYRGADWRQRREAGAAKGQRLPRLFHESWDDAPFYLRDENKRVTHWDFFGGTLRGIEEKLDDLRGLGVTVLYLNPIFAAASNHRYDTADYFEIDPALGDTAGFTALCRAAGDRGMRVILDGVFSHTGADSRYFDRWGRYGGGACAGPASPYYRWYDFQEFPGKYRCWWGEPDLPEVSELDPGFLDLICGENGVVRHWLRLGASGWRLDVADELPDPFIRAVRAAAMAEKPDALLLGEVWEDASNKVSYGVRRDYLLGGGLHGVMNYPFRQGLVDFILGRTDAPALAFALTTLRDHYPPGAFAASLNLLGSHDRARILTVLGGEGDRALALRRQKALSFLQFTLPGVPCVYYGDEAGLTGGEDPDNRRPYPWGREDQSLLSHYRWLCTLRRDHPALISGGFDAQAPSPEELVLRRGSLTAYVNRTTLEYRLEAVNSA